MSLAYEPTENPCYNNSLFWHYAKFSKLMLTIIIYLHDPMNFIVSFDVKHCQYFHWINGDLYGAIKSFSKKLKIISMTFEKTVSKHLKIST